MKHNADQFELGLDVASPRQVIIGLLGAKQAGKDSVYSCIARHTPAARLAFADGVKEEIADATGMTVEWVEANKEKLRVLLQVWGTELRRDLFDREYWVKHLLRKLHHVKTPLVVVTDVRFPNEARAITERGGILVRVIRGDQMTPSDGHRSEAWWVTEEARQLAPQVIENNGSFADLDTNVRAFLFVNELNT